MACAFHVRGTGNLQDPSPMSFFTIWDAITTSLARTTFRTLTLMDGLPSPIFAAIGRRRFPAGSQS